jgi:hypothetical protein
MLLMAVRRMPCGLALRRNEIKTRRPNRPMIGVIRLAHYICDQPGDELGLHTITPCPKTVRVLNLLDIIISRKLQRQL